MWHLKRSLLGSLPFTDFEQLKNYGFGLGTAIERIAFHVHPPLLLFIGNNPVDLCGQ